MKKILVVAIIALGFMSVNASADVAEKGQKSISIFLLNSDTGGSTSTTVSVGLDIAVRNGLTIGGNVSISESGSSSSLTLGGGLRKYFATSKPISPYIGAGISIISGTNVDLTGIRIEGGIKQPISETASIDYNYSVASYTAENSSATTEISTLLVGISINF